jgi:hypothetical protein
MGTQPNRDRFPANLEALCKVSLLDRQNSSFDPGAQAMEDRQRGAYRTGSAWRAMLRCLGAWSSRGAADAASAAGRGPGSCARDGCSRLLLFALGRLLLGFLQCRCSQGAAIPWDSDSIGSWPLTRHTHDLWLKWLWGRKVSRGWRRGIQHSHSHSHPQKRLVNFSSSQESLCEVWFVISPSFCRSHSLFPKGFRCRISCGAVHASLNQHFQVKRRQGTRYKFLQHSREWILPPFFFF